MKPPAIMPAVASGGLSPDAPADESPTLRIAVFHNLPEAQYASGYKAKLASLGIEVVQSFAAPFGHQRLAKGLDFVALCAWQLSHPMAKAARQLATEAGLRWVMLPGNPSTWAGILKVERALPQPIPAVPGQESAGSFSTIQAAYVAYTTELHRLAGEVEVSAFTIAEKSEMADECLREVERAGEEKKAAVAARDAIQEQNDRLREEVEASRVEIGSLEQVLLDVFELDEAPVDAAGWRATLAALVTVRQELDSDLEKAKNAILGLQEQLAMAQAAQKKAEASGGGDDASKLRWEDRLRRSEETATHLQNKVLKLDAELAEAKRSGTQIRASAGPLLTDETRADVESIQRLARRGHMDIAEAFAKVISIVTGKDAA